MKNLLLSFFVCCALLAKANIVYDMKEYKPKGRHYTSKINVLYYASYPASISGDKLTLLYFRTSNNTIIFKGLWISKSLESKIPMIVVKYIGKHILDVKLKQTHSLKDCLEVTKKAINKALDQTWLNALKNTSVSFSDRSLYKREYAGFDMNYYEFFPIEKNDLTNPTDLHDTTVLKVYTDSLLINQKVISERSKILSEVKDALLKKPDFDKTVSWQKYRYDNLMDVISKLGTIAYHHNDLKVSDWPLASPKRWGLATSAPNSFHTDSDSTCKYLMVLQMTLKKGEFMPAMAWKQNYGNWKATRCNLFAGDFSQQTLGLSIYPWGTKDWRAHEIHDNLPNIKDFVPITWDKAWEYANLGYPVFITTPKPLDGDAGHIALAYPISSIDEVKITDRPETALEIGMVVQAGSDNGLMLVGSAFKGSDFVKYGTAYIYLGYLKIN